MKKFFKLLPVGLVSFIATAFVAYMSLSVNPMDVNDLPLFPGADKIAHIILYYFLTLAYIFDYSNHIYPHHIKLNIELALCASAFVLGVLMEAGQGFLDMGRSMSFYDGIANLVGVLLCFISEKLFIMKWYRDIMRTPHHHHYHHSANNQETNTENNTDTIL